MSFAILADIGGTNTRVALARGEDCNEAVEQAKAVAARVEVLF